MESFKPSADFTLVRKIQDTSKPEKRSSGLLIPTNDEPSSLSRCEIVASEVYEKGTTIVVSQEALTGTLKLNSETFFVIYNKAILGKIEND